MSALYSTLFLFESKWFSSSLDHTATELAFCPYFVFMWHRAFSRWERTRVDRGWELAGWREWCMFNRQEQRAHAEACLKCKWNSVADLLRTVSVIRPLPARIRCLDGPTRWVELMMWMNQMTSGSETDSHSAAAAARRQLAMTNNRHLSQATIHAVTTHWLASMRLVHVIHWMEGARQQGKGTEGGNGGKR